MRLRGVSLHIITVWGGRSIPDFVGEERDPLHSVIERSGKGEKNRGGKSGRKIDSLEEIGEGSQKSIVSYRIVSRRNQR